MHKFVFSYLAAIRMRQLLKFHANTLKEVRFANCQREKYDNVRTNGKIANFTVTVVTIVYAVMIFICLILKLMFLSKYFIVLGIFCIRSCFAHVARISKYADPIKSEIGIQSVRLCFTAFIQSFGSVTFTILIHR